MPINIDALCYALTETFNLFAPAITFTNFVAFTRNFCKLKHLSKAEGNIISMNIPSLKKPLDKKEKTEKEKEFIKPYVEKLIEYTDEKNLNTLFRNIDALTISKSFNPLFGGSYNPKKNKIKLTNKSSFGHELLHMSSSYYDTETKIRYSGFEQEKNLTMIGNGLNEGYTELLASRIYKRDKNSVSYPKEVQIARLFEFFFNNPKDMEKYYFNHDLPGFVHYMENFAPRNEILKLIHQVDNINTFDTALANPTPTINYISSQVKLYNIFKNSNPDPEKLEDFRSTIYDHSTMAGMIIDGKTFKLNHSMQKKATEGHTK